MRISIRIFAERRDLPLEPETIIAQTPQGGERVDFGTVIMSAEESGVSASQEHHLLRNGKPKQLDRTLPWILYGKRVRSLLFGNQIIRSYAALKGKYKQCQFYRLY